MYVLTLQTCKLPYTSKSKIRSCSSSCTNLKKANNPNQVVQVEIFPCQVEEVMIFWATLAFSRQVVELWAMLGSKKSKCESKNAKIVWHTKTTTCTADLVHKNHNLHKLIIKLAQLDCVMVLMILVYFTTWQELSIVDNFILSFYGGSRSQKSKFKILHYSLQNSHISKNRALVFFAFPKLPS